jgi:ATP-dependent Clp protease ATP-binding subunit ClpC
VDFKNTILIMTSNIGTRDLKRGGGFGFGSGSAKDEYGAMKSTIEDALKRVFNPEFLNRIDDTIIFHPLGKSHIMEIVQIQMRALVKRMASMGISIELTKQAKEFLAEKGYDPAFGARPLRRALQKHLEDPIAEELLKGKYIEGTKIRVKVNKRTGELKFSAIQSTKSPDSKAEEEKPASVS